MTEPIADLHPGNGDIFNEFAELLEELTNYGTHILSWAIDQAQGSDEQLPVILIFRNILEHLDGISILVRKSSIEPSKNLLRVMFESMLQLEYMLEADSHRRALAFLVCGVHQELKFIEKISEGTAAHQQLAQKFKADKLMPGIDTLKAIPGAVAQKQHNERLLRSTLYQPAEAEYQRMATAGKKNPAWYQLFDGPSNLEQLAGRLDRQAMYEILYRAWSGTIHGQNVVKGNLTNGKTQGIAQIRNPQDAKQVTLHACNLALLLYGQFVKKRLPAELAKFKSWYRRIQPQLVLLR